MVFRPFGKDFGAGRGTGVRQLTDKRFEGVERAGGVTCAVERVLVKHGAAG
jgi:hypothetical protein